MKVSDVESYLNDTVPRAWERADVNITGRVEAERVPMMMREIVGNVIQGFGLQVQKLWYYLFYKNIFKSQKNW